jgi:hypothetical protein
MCKSIKKGCLQTDLSVHGQLFYYERSVLRQLFHAGNIAQNAIELLDYGRVTENIAQYTIKSLLFAAQSSCTLILLQKVQ